MCLAAISVSFGNRTPAFCAAEGAICSAIDSAKFKEDWKFDIDCFLGKNIRYGSHRKDGSMHSKSAARKMSSSASSKGSKS